MELLTAEELSAPRRRRYPAAENALLLFQASKGKWKAQNPPEKDLKQWKKLLLHLLLEGMASPAAGRLANGRAPLSPRSWPHLFKLSQRRVLSLSEFSLQVTRYPVPHTNYKQAVCAGRAVIS